MRHEHDESLRRPAIPVSTLVIISGATTAFVINLDQSIVILAVPSIGDALGTTLSQVQWIVSAFLLPLAAVLVLGGMVADRFGPGRVLLLGLGVFVAGTVGSALASQVGVLVLMRVVAGLGAALAMPASVAAMQTQLQGPKMTFGLAVWFSGALGGSAVGPVLGGMLLALGPWNLVFWMSSCVALIGLVSARMVVKRTRTISSSSRIRLLPSFIGGMGLALFVWGLISAGEFGWDHTPSIIRIVVGVVVVALGGLSARWDPRGDPGAREPFETRKLVGGLSLMTASVFGVVGAVFFTIIFMQSILGFSPLLTGLALLPFGGLAAVLSPLAAATISRYGLPRVFLIVAVAEICGLYGLSVLSVNSTYATVGPFLALLGLAMAFLPTISLSLALSASPQNRTGLVSGAHAAALQLGQLVSIAIIGSIVSVGVGDAYQLAATDAGVSGELDTAVVQQIARGDFESAAGRLPGLEAGAPRRLARSAFAEGVRVGVRIGLEIVAGAFLLLFIVLRGRMAIGTVEQEPPSPA